jgi:rhamnosyltransferase subunit B
VRTVLLVSELGGGFGHVRRLLPLARQVAAQGFTPMFLVRNPGEVAAVMEGEPFAVGAAPSVRGRVPAPAGRSRVARSFADLLGVAGFSDVGALGAALTAWDAVIAELRPVAIVCEHSPLLCLTVRGRDVPALVVGYGFVLPPPHLPRFPALSNAEPTHHEAALLANVRAVLRRRGRIDIDALPALLAGDAHFVTGLEVLDPYRARRRERAVGPPGVDPRRTSRDPEEELFAYLLGDAPATRLVLAGLERSGARGRVYVRRGTEALRRELAGGALTWLERPADARQALERARLVVHHGSMAMAEEALLSGRPQLVVPLYLEHLLTAHALEVLGAGTTMAANAPPAAIDAAIDQARADPAPARAADAFARAAPPAPDLARILATVLRDT